MVEFEAPHKENVCLPLLLENSSIISKIYVCTYMSISLDVITDKDICRHK